MSHLKKEMPSANFTAISKTRGLFYLDDIELPKCIKGYLDRSSMIYVENGHYPLEGERFREPFEVKVTEFGPIFTAPRVFVYSGSGDRESIDSWSTFPQFVLVDNEKEVGRYRFGRLYSEIDKNYRPKLQITPTTKHGDLLSTLFGNLTEVGTLLQLAHLFKLNLADDEFEAASSNEVFYSIFCEKLEEVVGKKGLQSPLFVEKLNSPIGMFAPPGGFSKTGVLQYRDDDGVFQPFEKTIVDRIREYVSNQDVGRAIVKLIPVSIKGKANPNHALWMSILSDKVNRQYGATLKEYSTKKGDIACSLNINGAFIINKPGLTPQSMVKLCTKTIIPSSRTETELSDVEFSKLALNTMAGLVYMRIELNCVCTKIPSIGTVAKITKVILKETTKAPKGLDSAATSILEKLNLIPDDIEGGDESDDGMDPDYGGETGTRFDSF